MAFGMREWLVSAGAASLLVAVWLLPPDPPEVRTQRSDRADSTTSRASHLRERVRQLQEALARIEIEDTLEARVEGAAGRVEVIVPAAVPDSTASAHRRRVAATLDTLGMAEPRVTLLRATFPGRYAVHEPEGWTVRGVIMGGRRGWLVFQGAADGEPYCAVVRRVGRLKAVVSEDLASDPDPDQDPLNFCRLHARYGPPGPPVGRWLEDQGAFALAATRSRGERPDDRFVRFPFDFQDPPFARNALHATSDPAVARCLAGSAEECAGTVLDPQALDRWWPSTGEAVASAPGFDPFFIGWGRFALAYRGYAYAYLADLEREFGTERFEAFWTTRRPVPEAFEDAFGESVGAYTHRWATERLGPLRPGPGPSAASTGASLLVLGLLVGAGAWIGQRRSVV